MLPDTAAFSQEYRKSAAARAAVKYGFDPFEAGKQFLFNVAFLDNIIYKGFFAAAFKFPLIRQIP